MKKLGLGLLFWSFLVSSWGQQPVPEYQSYSLKNGLKVVFLNYGKIDAVAVQLVVNSGEKNETPEQTEFSDIAANMTLMGNAKYSATDQKVALYKLGTNISASAGADFTTWTAEFLTRDLTSGMDLLFQTVTQPKFDPEYLSQYTDQLATFNNPSRMDIGELADKSTDEWVFGTDHPFGRYPTADGYAQITPEKLREFYDFNVAPSTSTLVLCGKFDVTAAKSLIESVWGSWQGKYAQSNQVKLPQPAFKSVEVKKVLRAGADQTMLVFTGNAPAQDADDALTFTIANDIFSDMLFREVREKGGKTYGIGSQYIATSVSHIFQIKTQVRSKESQATAALVDQVMDDVATKGFSKTDFDASIMKFRNQVLSLETPSALLSFYNPLRFKFEKRKLFLSNLDKLTFEQVNAIGKKYLGDAKYKLMMVGPEN
jgi:predicted Zn-dependent peptidase